VGDLLWKIRAGGVVVEILPGFFGFDILPNLSTMAQSLEMPSDVIVSHFLRSKPSGFQRWWSLSLFEHCLESLEDAEVVPIGRGSVIRGVNCVKPIIINQVILGRDVSGPEVANHTNIFSVDGGNSNILSSAGSGLPLWDLATS
jgi:hypothetical protein